MPKIPRWPSRWSVTEPRQTTKHKSKARQRIIPSMMMEYVAEGGGQISESHAIKNYKLETWLSIKSACFIRVDQRVGVYVGMPGSDAYKLIEHTKNRNALIWKCTQERRTWLLSSPNCIKARQSVPHSDNWCGSIVGTSLSICFWCASDCASDHAFVW